MINNNSERQLPKKLGALLYADNIAEKLDPGELQTIGGKVVEWFDVDVASLAGREEINGKAMKLTLQSVEKKTFPWMNASNVKHPLLTVSVLQFQARAMSALLSGQNIVKVRVFGNDADGAKLARAKRVSRHMSWQLLEQEENWIDDTDRLLCSLCVYGTMFRKVYFNREKGHNDSVVLSPLDVIVNNAAESLDRAPRVTQKIKLYRHEILERIRSGQYSEVELNLGEEDEATDEEGGLVLFLEQHTAIDLDGDGYPEPYVVTVHKDSGKVVRISPRFTAKSVQYGRKGQISKITAQQQFIKFTFLPSPDGSFYAVGFGAIISPLNSAVNTILNQLIDSGTLSNTQAGFVSDSVRFPRGATEVRPGQMTRVKALGPLNNSFLPFQFPGPSPVLLQLLGILLDAGKQISTISDLMTGESKKGETATTTMTRSEQGMKMFSSIVKRIHRALRREFAARYDLNAMYVDPAEYERVLDEPGAGFPAMFDYEGDSADIAPSSDPNMSSQTQAVLQTEALLQFAQDPRINGMEILMRHFRALGVDDPEKLIADQPAGPPPDVVMDAARLENQRLGLEIKKAEAEVRAVKTQAEAVLALAKAEAEEAGPQLEFYKAQLERMKLDQEKGTNGQDDFGGLGGISSRPQNEGVPAVGGTERADNQEGLG